VQGSSTSYTATVSALNGFSGVVGFSVTGPPTGVTATFTPTSVTGSGSTTLNVMTSTTTPVGSYTLTITGTSGTLTRSTAVTLVVNAQTDFTLSATPSPQTVVQGSATSYTATVSALNGFSGVVGFSVTGPPTGATAAFTPTSVTGSGSSTLTVTTSTATPIGSYTLTITGTSGTLTHSTPVTLVVNASPASTPAGLVAAFGFDEDSGSTVSDASGTGNHGTILNATRTTAGRYGRALLFNGSNAWVTVADSASLDLTTAMTLEAWVRPTAAMGTSWRSIVLKEHPDGLSYSLYANTSSARSGAYINTGGSDLYVNSTSNVPAGVWTHLAATYDGTMLRLYVNGTLVRSASFPGAVVVSGDVLRIGGNSVWGEYFSGSIDEVRIYNRALSAAEIATDMNAAIVR
jgi:hypothetical protein